MEEDRWLTNQWHILFIICVSEKSKLESMNIESQGWWGCSLKLCDQLRLKEKISFSWRPEVDERANYDNVKMQEHSCQCKNKWKGPKAGAGLV